MEIKDKISQIDYEIKKLTEKIELLKLEREELSKELPLTIYEKNWDKLCEELTNDYFLNPDLFLYSTIYPTKSTTEFFSDFLYNKNVKYLVLKNSFIYDEQDFFQPLFCSLVLIKSWPHVVRTKSTLTISELKRFTNKSYKFLANENNHLKQLYKEINDIYDNVGIDGCFYEFTAPISLYAQPAWMHYGKAKEFLIAGIIIDDENK